MDPDQLASEDVFFHNSKAFENRVDPDQLASSDVFFS